MIPQPLRALLMMLAGWIHRQQQETIAYLLEENRVLREQLPGGRPHLNDRQRRRLAVKGKILGRKLLERYAGIVTPDTILRWYRRLVAKKYDGSKKRGTGRPSTAPDIAKLVLDMAGANPRWGYSRIRDALAGLGHKISRYTVKRILQDAGIEPAPARGQRTPWKTFLRLHFDAIVAADFFTVEVLTMGGLVRYHVFFLIELATRRIEIAGITHEPAAAWMQQVGRNLTGLGGFLDGKRYLIIDRDPLYTEAFCRLLRDSGVEPLRLPPSSPNLNAFAERFVLSIKSEALERMVILGERHLRHAVSQFLAHYHAERHHQGLDGALIELREAACSDPSAPVTRTSRLGGLLNFYSRDAA